MRLFNDGPAGTYKETQLQAGDMIIFQLGTGCIAFCRNGSRLYIWDGTQHNSYKNKWPIHPNTRRIDTEESSALVSLIAALSGFHFRLVESTGTLEMYQLGSETKSPPACD